jgi:HEPN domain-containing protein
MEGLAEPAVAAGDGERSADVVGESQEIVELALKGLLRSCGIDPPRIHDVSDVLGPSENACRRW